MPNQPIPSKRNSTRPFGMLSRFKAEAPARFGNLPGGHEAVLQHHGWKVVHRHEDMSVWHHPKHQGYVVHENVGRGVSHLHHGEMNSGGAEDHVGSEYSHNKSISDHHELDSHLHRYHAAMEKADKD